jgi:DNA-binding NarL/FixJ family response regulator
MLMGRVYEQRLKHAIAIRELAWLRAEVDRRREAVRVKATLADQLNHNERQIVRLVADGRSAAEIGEALHLSPRTVETYRSRLMQKLGIDDLSSLVKFAIRSGITSLEEAAESGTGTSG